MSKTPRPLFLSISLAVGLGVPLAVPQSETLILRSETEAGAEVLQDVPEDQMSKIARFLEGQGYKEQALEVATDPEVRASFA